MRYLPVLVVIVLALAGCVGTDETVLEPPPSAGGGTELRLGPGVRAISEGPGYKGSPAWSPDGERLAYVVDGYIVESSATYTGVASRETERDFGAQSVAWENPETLISSIRTPRPGPTETDVPTPPGEVSVSPLYRIATDGQPEDDNLRRLASAAQSYTVIPRGSEDHQSNEFLISTREGAVSVVSRVRDGNVTSISEVRGEVGGICTSPDGSRAVLGVRSENGNGKVTYSIRVMNLTTGVSSEVVELDGGGYIASAPQWTNQGIYYLAGNVEETSGNPEESTISGYAGTQRLYLVEDTPDGARSRPAPGPGSAFTASNIRVSPDRDSIAVAGRLRADSPTNIYILDTESDELRSLTENEDMEIKNGPEDLAWSPSGDYLAIVARGISPTGTRTYPAPSDALLEAFYNVYRVPVS